MKKTSKISKNDPHYKQLTENHQYYFKNCIEILNTIF